MTVERWQASLDQLRRGNDRYCANAMTLVETLAQRRPLLAQGQRPHSVVVGCSDSRVPPEIIFDQGLGDLFVIRVAGNVIDSLGLGSIEYASMHLGVPLIIILGHTSCGAVSAALAGSAEGHVEAILAEIEPSVAAVRGLPGDLLENATRENALRTGKRMLSLSPGLTHLVRTGRLRILAAHNDLPTGTVDYFTTAPSGLGL